MNRYHILYFKPSGKYYTDVNVSIGGDQMDQVCDNLRAMFRDGMAPGLAAWHGSFHVVIMPIEPTTFGYPCMIPIGFQAKEGR